MRGSVHNWLACQKNAGRRQPAAERFTVGSRPAAPHDDPGNTQRTANPVMEEPVVEYRIRAGQGAHQGCGRKAVSPKERRQMEDDLKEQADRKRRGRSFHIRTTWKIRTI